MANTETPTPSTSPILVRWSLPKDERKQANRVRAYNALVREAEGYVSGLIVKAEDAERHAEDLEIAASNGKATASQIIQAHVAARVAAKDAEVQRVIAEERFGELRIR